VGSVFCSQGPALNFLAHALLAGEAPALIVGGVVGDWIKGPLPGVLPGDLAKGVALHRAIDSFADTHAAFRRSRSRVSPGRRRYAGVLVDVFYDHLLARNWAAIGHHRPLNEYCEAVYRLVKDRLNELPVSSHTALSLMAKEDWLTGYAKIEGIADVLARMSRRTRQPNPLANGELEFLADVDGFTSDFYSWLDDTKAFCQRWLTE
jgi:acyl carrier protein phosphodiesterase